MKDKIKLLFNPYLLTFFGLIIGYSFINWLLFLKFQLFQTKEVYTNLGIPIVLTILAALFILKPKLKILNLERDRGNWRSLYTFILWLVLTIPLIIAQEYLVTATGKLTKIESINDINKFSQSKYYLVSKYHIDKTTIGVHPEFEVSGKNNTDFNMHIYVSLPMFEKAIDTGKVNPEAWLGTEYHKTIKNSLDLSEKEQKFKEFLMDSQKDFENKNVTDFVYFNRLSHSDKREGVFEAIKSNQIYKPNENILEGINEPFEERNGHKLEWLLGSSIVGSILWLILLSIPKIDNQQLKRIQDGEPDKETQDEIEDFLSLFKAKEEYFITPILIYGNVFMYLLLALLGYGFISFEGKDLLDWGANFGPLTTNGEWWRLLTSTFLHGGLMHLFANMYGLLFVGVFLEPLLGRVKYLSVYILTGIIASIASVWWYDATVSVGASGAIFGLYGVFLALLLSKMFAPDFAKPFLLSTSIFIGYNLLMGFAGEGIDNAAHIGGLLSGFVIGLILVPILKNQIKNN